MGADDNSALVLVSELLAARPDVWLDLRVAGSWNSQP